MILGLPNRFQRSCRLGLDLDRRLVERTSAISKKVFGVGVWFMMRALVTGSAQGIGRAIADTLVSRGYGVVGADVQFQEGTEFEVLALDVSDSEACRQAVAELGHFDVLVNNAGVLVEKSPESISDEEFDLTMAINLRAPFVLSVAVSDGMKERGWGRIVNISSVGARTGGISQSSVYAASKAGLLALTKNFARNLGPFGITTNAVLPGAIASPMATKQFEKDEALKRQVVAANPTGRLGSPEEVASVVAFLVSDEAAYLNGGCIDVNGGWVMT